jgi:hypothetical protein
MSQTSKKKGQEDYAAPACSQVPFFSEAALCETSFTSNGIEPGQGVDWGQF